jgi:hypothetical protein
VRNRIQSNKVEKAVEIGDFVVTSVYVYLLITVAICVNRTVQ